MERKDSISNTDAVMADGELVEPSVEQVEQSGPREGRAKRRTFTTEYKRRIVEEYDAAQKGTKGAILRRERLYDSHIQEWRAAVQAGTLDAPVRRGRPKGSGKARSPEQARIVELERENARLKAEVSKREEDIAKRDDALDLLGKGVAFLEALSSRNAS
jgi:transposase